MLHSQNVLFQHRFQFNKEQPQSLSSPKDYTEEWGGGEGETATVSNYHTWQQDGSSNTLLCIVFTITKI